MSEIKAITTSEMIAKLPQATDASVKPPSLRSLRVEAEIEAIRRTLEFTGWNRRRAAQLLSISYRGILYKIRQHNLTPRVAESAGPMLKADSQG
jgi:two-component system, NtrC family, response regulator AtoC